MWNEIPLLLCLVRRKKCAHLNRLRNHWSFCSRSLRVCRSFGFQSLTLSNYIWASVNYNLLVFLYFAFPTAKLFPCLPNKHSELFQLFGEEGIFCCIYRRQTTRRKRFRRERANKSRQKWENPDVPPKFVCCNFHPNSAFVIQPNVILTVT